MITEVFFMSTNLATKNPKRPKQIISSLIGIINGIITAGHRDSGDDFYNVILKAKQELADSELYFDSVTDPELIDHAIYRMEAARSHYTYLIKEAKARGIRVKM